MACLVLVFIDSSICPTFCKEWISVKGQRLIRDSIVPGSCEPLPALCCAVKCELAKVSRYRGGCSMMTYDFEGKIRPMDPDSEYVTMNS